MSDEVDDLLRRTMATLDRQVPDGYFDTLVSRALVRLADPALGELPDPRGDEPQDSHDEDAPPASSGPGWKAIALAEPAKPPAGPTLEVVDERVESAVDVIRRTLKTEDVHPVCCQLL